MLQTLSEHAHVVKVLGFVQDSILEGVSLTVMEHAELGNLKAYVKRQQSEWQPQDTTQALLQVVLLSTSSVSCLMSGYVLQIASAMAWLAERRVVHRDLALRNILLFQADPLLCKLADFGRTCLQCQ